MKLYFLFSDGREMQPAQKPCRMTLSREDRTPADALSVAFAAEKPLFAEEPWGVRADLDGVSVFYGIVDEHTTRTERGLRQEQFDCRSFAALLLDNEAMPGTLHMPSLRLMEKLYLTPLGLKAEGTDFAPKRGRITVERGSRCWDVLCEFAERFLKCTPVCGEDGTVRFSAAEQRRLELPELRKLTVTRKPAERISRVVVQDSQTGAYSAVYENPNVSVTRVRYLSAQSDTAPNTIFAEAERGALQICAVCGGYVHARPGDRADLSAWVGEPAAAEVISVRFHAENETGETELTFTACAG